ncbi:outer membrane protein OmpU [Palleronia aestuarii]|uniref:Outer membrane protein OmpU n=1 Tax=Palleronia aestuarii TaxID=568105 RepID=A0A2W7NG16_9RHOB|nr:porin [Palleronia aestuarii]PZX18850.1 outer membrane protein OmpU [Palleronia aestuarii]
MKQILFATTALVASTSFAMADVDISGFAEMGIFGGENTDGSEIDTQFHTDIDATFSMSGETDNGLTFGASVDLDEQIGDNNADDGLGESGATRDDSDDGGATMFVSGSLGTLTMGDTDGAYDFALSESIIGATLRDDNEHLGYSGNNEMDGLYDGQIVRYDYTFGAFTVAVSAEIDDAPDSGLIDFDNFDGQGFTTNEIGSFLETQAAEIDNDTVLSVGGRYQGTFGAADFGVGVGYQRAGNDQIVSITTNEAGDAITDVEFENEAVEAYGFSVDFSMENGFQGVLDYSEYDNLAGLDNHLGLAAGYEFGALLVALNYGKFELEDGGDNSGYALTANYDLGGGAQLQGGYAQNKPESGEDYDRFSFGIAMSF